MRFSRRIRRFLRRHDNATSKQKNHPQFNDITPPHVGNSKASPLTRGQEEEEEEEEAEEEDEALDDANNWRFEPKVIKWLRMQKTVPHSTLPFQRNLNYTRYREKVCHFGYHYVIAASLAVIGLKKVKHISDLRYFT